MSRSVPQSSSGSASITNTAPPQNVEGDARKTDQQTHETPPRELGGRDGPDPTRFGDWEKNGRCIDF